MNSSAEPGSELLRRRWQRIARWLPFAIVALIGVAGAIAAQRMAVATDDVRIRGVMELRAEWRARDFERKLDLLASDVNAMAVLLASEKTIDPTLFERFAARSHQAGAPLQRLVWAPRVAGVPSGGDTFPAELQHEFVKLDHGAEPDLAANPGWRSVMQRRATKRGR